MQLQFPNGYVDYDLDLFREIVPPIDRRIRYLLSVNGEFGNMMDYPTTVDHLIGIGLAAAQVYLGAVIAYQGAPRQAGLAVGPQVCRGQTVAQLINHGANFWKHADGWDYSRPDKRRKAIELAFVDVGITDDAEPLRQLICKIAGSPVPSLAPLVPRLEEWRNALEAEFPKMA